MENTGKNDGYDEIVLLDENGEDHPEKSGETGLAILQNFAALNR